MEEEIMKEAIKTLISRHSEEFEEIKFQKKKEFEAFGSFVR